MVRRRGRALVGAGLVLAGMAGSTGAALMASAPGGAATTTSVSLRYTCATDKPVALTGLAVPVTLQVTAPTSVQAGSSFTVSASSSVSLPSAISSTVGALGITSITVSSVSAVVNGTHVAPTTQTDGAQGLPLSITAAQVANPIAVKLTPLTFTAGSSGPAVFTAGKLTVVTTLSGGTFNGTVTTLSCAANSGNPNLGSVAVTAAPSVPAMMAISPSTGPAAGGTQVTITGTGLSGATGVSFGSTPATHVTVNSATSITATSPAGTAGSTVDVTVTGPGGTSATSASDRFTYASSGSGTSATTSVSLKYTCATDKPVTLTGLAVPVTLQITAPTSVTAGSPVDVSAASSVSLPTAITATAGALGITSVQVNSVSAVVNGTNVTPTTQTDGAQGLPLTIQSAELGNPVAVKLTPLTFTAGSSGPAVFTAGNLTVVTTLNGGTFNGTTTTLSCTPNSANPNLGSIAITGTTTHPAPAVTAISPTAGPAAGGTQVTITGSGFTGATGVSFGSTAATNVTVNSDISITATSPAGSAGSKVDVTVTGPNGVSSPTAADQFTYATQPNAKLPTIMRMFPSQGPTLGYQLVWILGTNFNGVSSVKFGDAPALYRAFSSHLLIALSPPASAPGKVDVMVTNAAGTSTTTPADRFTYVREFCFLFFCFG